MSSLSLKTGYAPLLPLNLSQIGLVGASGLMNGLVDCEHPHVIKGRIVREKKQKNLPGDNENVIQTSEVESNKMIFNILGWRKSNPSCLTLG